MFRGRDCGSAGVHITCPSVAPHIVASLSTCPLLRCYNLAGHVTVPDGGQPKNSTNNGPSVPKTDLGAAKEFQGPGQGFQEQIGGKPRNSKGRFGGSQGIPRTRPRIPRADLGSAKEFQGPGQGFQEQIGGKRRNSKDRFGDGQGIPRTRPRIPRADLGSAREFQGPGQGFQGQIWGNSKDDFGAAMEFQGPGQGFQGQIWGQPGNSKGDLVHPVKSKDTGR